MSDLRGLPAVEQLMQTEKAAALTAAFGRSLTLEAIRSSLADLRVQFVRGDNTGSPTTRETILFDAEQKLNAWLKPSLLAVINASGVVLHTNLGRAPLSEAALQAAQCVSAGYSSLEFDLEKGARGSRHIHAEGLLTRLTGAEAALVVNNCAAALLLCLSALAKRKRVVISRSQLVEIGGGFRIPDVMSLSGAKLVEVGTTNRVHVRDYEIALEEPVALVLRAHHSNFKIIGFTTEPGIGELVSVAHAHGAAVLDDLGSGALFDTSDYGLSHEPMVQESLAAGADLVCFSGDKLLGGPQAGIILGKSDLIARVKKHPLARAVRADKLCLAALTATLTHYLKEEALHQIPIWRMIATPVEQIRMRALGWQEALQVGQVLSSQSTIGGGSLPEESLPTYVLALNVPQPNRFLARLREVSLPIIARIEDERVLCDPRTVFPEQEGAFLAGMRYALNMIQSSTTR
jgi:L-seryl-tRNA(Ser) seleniumtransferase